MEQLVLTRYLFSLNEVRQSLYIEILDRNYQAALYWCYELYWSGYEEDTFEFLLNAYEEVFVVNDLFKEKFEKEYEKWKNDNSLHETIGNIVINMCFRKYNISKFILKYFKLNCKEKVVENNESLLYINLSKLDIKEYETINETRNYKVLKKVYKYDLRTEVNKIFEYEINKNEQLEKVRSNWELYAFDCPYWKSKITEYGGYLEDKKIKFNNVENEEEFYNLYDLELDEQPKYVQDKCIGKEQKNLTIKNFIEKYNGIILSGKLKKKIVI